MYTMSVSFRGPPFALVKSHTLDLGAFQFDMASSLLPAVLPIVHARQSFFRPPRACVASYRGTLGLRVHRSEARTVTARRH